MCSCTFIMLPVDAGHEDIEIVGKIAGEAFRVAPFNCKIKLAFERVAQLADDLDRPVATDFGHLALNQMRKVIEDPEISVDLCLDSGAESLGPLACRWRVWPGVSARLTRQR